MYVHLNNTIIAHYLSIRNADSNTITSDRLIMHTIEIICRPSVSKKNAYTKRIDNHNPIDLNRYP